MKDMCSKKKLDLVTNKEGKRICQKSSFPEYDPEYTYQGPSQTNIRNYCLQGKDVYWSQGLKLCTFSAEL